MGKIDEYVRLFPEEIREAIKSLSEDTRLAIMICLMINEVKEKPGMTFSELMSDLEISQGLLNSHLKNLLESGLVKNEYRKVVGRRDYSFYMPTTLGSSFMVSLLESLEKPIMKSIPTEVLAGDVPLDATSGPMRLETYGTATRVNTNVLVGGRPNVY